MRLKYNPEALFNRPPEVILVQARRFSCQDATVVLSGGSNVDSVAELPNPQARRRSDRIGEHCFDE
jgi:hypothetical protein